MTAVLEAGPVHGDPRVASTRALRPSGLVVVGRRVAALPAELLVGLVRLYQLLSGALGRSGRCRFIPTCSGYALEAVQVHGAARGSLLAARRLCRCHPWGGLGPDPVPPARTTRSRHTRSHTHSEA